MPRHALSVDVEEHFQVLNFQRGIPATRWSEHPSRVADNTRRILDALDRRETRATFFCLGWVAERHPDLVPEIAARGHEVGSHGWSHAPLTRLDEATLAEELLRSREILRAQSGQEVIGFRAPSFSVVPRTLWALDVLLDCGYRYDSSMFPTRHPDYGMPGVDLAPHRAETPSGRSICEFPMTVAPLPLGRKLPVSGGGYFRLFPLALTRWGLHRVERRQRPVVFYLHPWEVDPEQPDLRAHTSRLGAFRHYTGLRRTLPRLERLLQEFSFGTCEEVLTARGLLAADAPCGLAGAAG